MENFFVSFIFSYFPVCRFMFAIPCHFAFISYSRRGVYIFHWPNVWRVQAGSDSFRKSFASTFTEANDGKRAVFVKRQRESWKKVSSCVGLA